MSVSLESAVDRLLDLVLPYSQDQEQVTTYIRGPSWLWMSRELEWI